jgi:heat shock protein HtpX
MLMLCRNLKQSTILDAGQRVDKSSHPVFSRVERVMFKRWGLFIAVNIGVMLTISIAVHVLGLNQWMSASGINYQMLALFCLLWGFGGAFISLAISKFMAKWSMGVKIIKPDAPASAAERKIVETVHRHAQRAGLTVMPEVGIYDSPEVNAFATGPSRRNSLVAVSTGLLSSMNEREVEGVIGHEVAHIANGDMVTMTLLQGVVNAFAMFIARIVGWFAANSVREELRGVVMFVTTIVLEILLVFAGSMVVAAFSRAREFRADSGGADLAGREKMIAALQALSRRQEIIAGGPGPQAAFKISSTRSSGGLRQLFSTHPSLEDRIRRLQQAG